MQKYKVGITKYERHNRGKSVVMSYGARYRSLRKFVLGAALVGMAVVAWAQEQTTADGSPKLVWERTFERSIVAVGVDEKCYTRTKGDITSCLKWVLLFGGELRWFDRDGKLTTEPVEGIVKRGCVSPNGKYFFGFRQEKKSEEKKRVIYTLYNWDGERIWETDQFVSRPVVWNDGSAVSRLERIHMEDFFDTKQYARGVMFFGAQGRMTSTFEFPEVHYRWGRHRGYAISDNFFAMVRLSPKKEYELYVFKKNGDLVWKQERIRRHFFNQENTSGAHTSGGVTVSDRGEVLFLFDHRSKYGTQVYVYDGKGALRDTLLLDETGILYPLRTEGRLAFVSTGRWLGVPSRFLCYDFDKMKLRFIITAEYDPPSVSFDVDTGAGLIALAAYRVDGGMVVKILDLDGDYLTEMKVDARGDGFWFRLLDGALLVAEKNKLRLYEIDVE